MSFLPTLIMEHFAIFVQSLASEVKIISDSLRMHKYLSKIQPQDRGNSGFRMRVGNMEHYFRVVNPSKHQKIRKALKKICGATSRYTQRVILNSTQMNWKAQSPVLVTYCEETDNTHNVDSLFILGKA